MHVLTRAVSRRQWRPIWTYQVRCGFYWDIAPTVEPPPPPSPEEERHIKHLANMSTLTAVKISNFSNQAQQRTFCKVNTPGQTEGQN